jgi:signal transduction histidine kinase
MAPEWLRLVVGTVCAVSAVVVLRRRMAPASALMLLACACLLVLSGATDTSSARRFAASLLATPLAPFCGAVAGLWWPVRPVGRWLLVVGGAALAAVLVSGALRAIAFDPTATGCFRCPDNLLAVPSASAQVGAFDRTATVLVLLSGLLVAGVAVARWWRSARLARRTAWPMLLGGAWVAALSAVHAARALTTPRDLYDAWAVPMWNAQLVILTVIAVGGWWRLSLPRRTADRVARSVLAATPDPTALVASLAREIGDADLVVTYRRLDGSCIAVDGCLVDPPADRAVLRLTRDGATYAELWYAVRMGPESDVVRAVADSSGLALEYVAAQARLRAETLDAIAARRRVVARADAERGRLERDLHDGAQQGLVTLSMQLTAAAARPGSVGDGRLAEAQREITTALHDLRTIARGVFPVSLGEAGLVAALRELGDHTGVPLVVEGTLTEPVAPDVGMAVYDLVSDVTDATPEADGAVVRVAVDGGGRVPVRVTVTATPADRQRPARLTVRAEDRVAALGGTLTVSSTGSGLLVTSEIPCAS